MNIDKKTIAIAVVGLFVICIAGWYMFSGGIPDNGSGIDKARTNLQSTGSKQSEAIGRLDTIGTGLDSGAAEADRISAGLKDTADTITAAKDRIGQSKSELVGSTNLFAECKQILRTVRERGPARE